MCSFTKGLIGHKYILHNCICDERIQLMGLREGEEISLVQECPFGGTVLLNTRFGSFCVRREEIYAELEEVS